MFDPRSRFNPGDWYWRASDGRLYSSSRQTLVPQDDAAFKKFAMMPTPWPRDDDGNETTAALQAVLSQHGLFVDLRPYAAQKRWEREVRGITVNGVSVATDDRSKMMILGARVEADGDAAFTTEWDTADGKVVTLNAQAIIAISNAVLAHVKTCFAIYSGVKRGIDNGSITGTADIDRAFEA